jgi:hypothetical protein
MASKKRVRKQAPRRTKRKDDIAMNAEFIADVLNGNGAVQMYESRNAQGELEIEYDVEEDV